MATTNYFKELGVAATAVLAASLLVLVMAAGPALAAFPGENGKIAYTCGALDYDGFVEDICTTNSDGSGQTKLTSQSADDYDPVYASDGEKIAFVSERDGNAEIYVMNQDGSGQTRLTNHTASDSQPTFSPDGTKIAFTSDRDGTNELYVMNADGSGAPNRLTNNAADDSDPAFSPDGSKIAFTSDREGNREIYVMNADGSGTPTRLTDNPASDRAPTYAPDGSKVAFMSDRDDFPGDTAINNEIYVTTSDGTGAPFRLTNDTQASQAVDSDPAFSPDGTKIAFSSKHICTGFCGAIISGSYINVMSAADGSGRTALSNTEFGYSPDWGVGSSTPSPDTTPPDTEITSGPSGTVNSGSANFYFSSTEQGSSFQCSLDNAAFDSCASPKQYSNLSDGSHTFQVKATDGAGNADASPASRTWTVDASAPETTIDSGPPSVTNSRSATFVFSSSESGSTFRCSLDSAAISSCASPKAYSALAEGQHTFKVEAIDQAGNSDTTPAQRSFTVDATAPTGTVLISNGATRTRTRSVALTLNATDPSPGSGVTSMRVSNSSAGLSSAPWEPYNASKSWTLTAGSGTKTVYVQYRDGAGNTSQVAQDTIKYSP